MFLKRSSNKEMMDDFSMVDNRIKKALEELYTINRFLGGYAVTQKGIQSLLNTSGRNIKILDIGGGGSDVLSDLKEKYSLDIFSVDINKYTCHYQKNRHKEHHVICADALKLPIKQGSFDVVHISLFLHHFSEQEIIRMLRHFILVCTSGVIINDLRRNILAYAGIRILTMLFSRSTFVKYDGPLSVLRSFTISDLTSILSGAGINHYLIRRMWAFRFLIVILMVQDETN
jgi:ubiquinone/menaquinone biosynthesis C-methylase UbiE